MISFTITFSSRLSAVLASSHLDSKIIFDGKTVGAIQEIKIGVDTVDGLKNSITLSHGFNEREFQLQFIEELLNCGFNIQIKNYPGIEFVRKDDSR